MNLLGTAEVVAPESNNTLQGFPSTLPSRWKGSATLPGDVILESLALGSDNHNVGGLASDNYNKPQALYPVYPGN